MPLDRDALWDMMVMVQIAQEGSLSGAARALPGWELPPQVLWAVHARGPHLAARVRCFIKVMEREL